jgi:hypothetical protein
VFALNQLPAITMAFPDVCITMVVIVPVPIPYPNISFEFMGFPAAYNILVGGAPVHNMATVLVPSVGDLPGLMGVASGMVMGPNFSFVNSFTCLMGALPTKRLTSFGISNLTNAPAIAITPNQFKVLVLSP